MDKNLPYAANKMLEAGCKFHKREMILSLANRLYESASKVPVEGFNELASIATALQILDCGSLEDYRNGFRDDSEIAKVLENMER